MREAFSTIPKGKRGALVVIADHHGARAVLAANLNGNWKVALDAASPWAGPVTGSVSLQGSW
jgi:hypothetical protein